MPVASCAVTCGQSVRLPRARKAWACASGGNREASLPDHHASPLPAAGSRHPASRLMGSSPIGPKAELHDLAWQPYPGAQLAA